MKKTIIPHIINIIAIALSLYISICTPSCLMEPLSQWQKATAALSNPVGMISSLMA